MGGGAGGGGGLFMKGYLMSKKALVWLGLMAYFVFAPT